MIERLFVYGSLAPGRPNAHVLADVPGTWEPAVALGALREEGWGAAMGFPGLVLDDDGGEVAGLVFSSTQLGPHWVRLDAFEDGYARVLTQVRLNDGRRVEAWVYTVTGVDGRAGSDST